MDHRRNIRLWLLLALVVLVALALASWLPDLLLPGSSHSPLPTPSATGDTAAGNPALASTAPSLAPVLAALLWIALGIVLALGIVFVATHWHRRRAG